jgi:dihydropyrimidine dehydrogenase (NAD+) subunit PreT
MSTASIPDDLLLRDRFTEIKPPLAPQAAVIEANRCLNCFDAPCTAACPTHIDVPGFIKRISTGNLRGSALRILDANILGGSCAKVCPVEVLCEGACVMHRYNSEPIQIGRLQRYAMDSFQATGEELLTAPRRSRNVQVACIGGGPASLACAAELCRHGAHAIIIERNELLGGLNTYGIAEYKLRTSDSLREADMIRRMGVEFWTGAAIETAEALEELESEFDFLFLGVGLGAMQRMNIPGEDQKGVLNALEFIASYKTGRLREMAGTVVVVGAGNTAIDAASAAHRLGAETVYLLYRRGEREMTAFDFEYEHAKHEGVQFLWRRQPYAIRTNERGRLLLVPNSEYVIECDYVIPAIGQSPFAQLVQELRRIELRNGIIVVDPETGQTGNSRYFAGGDCSNGGREVVDAVADGKRAARAILKIAEAAYA